MSRLGDMCKWKQGELNSLLLRLQRSVLTHYTMFPLFPIIWKSCLSESNTHLVVYSHQHYRCTKTGKHVLGFEPRCGFLQRLKASCLNLIRLYMHKHHTRFELVSLGLRAQGDKPDFMMQWNLRESNPNLKGASQLFCH